MDGEFIGGQVKAARKLRGIETTKALAALLNKPRFGEKVIGQIERNERPAQAHEVEWFAAGFDLPASYFTETPAAPANPEGGIADVLAKLLAAVDKQNKLLDKQTEVLERIEKAIDREDEAAKTLRTEGQTWVARVEALARQGFADAPQTREEAQDTPGA